MTKDAPIALGCHRVRAFGALFIALTLPLLAAAGRPNAPANATQLLERLPSSWRADHGETLHFSALQGQRVFITMAYTTCHQICPMTMTRLTDIQRELDTRGVSAEFLIVSYDPSNDDPAAWRRYRSSRGLVRANWHFLSGTARDTEQLARLLGFDFWRDGDHVMHDYRIVALGGDGGWRGAIDSSHPDWRVLL